MLLVFVVLVPKTCVLQWLLVLKELILLSRTSVRMLAML